MSKKPQNRSTIVRTAGISSADPSRFARTAKALNTQFKKREASGIYDHAHGTSINQTGVKAVAISCPRCNKASCTAKLTDEEEVAYCTACRYTIPLPGSDG